MIAINARVGLAEAARSGRFVQVVGFAAQERFISDVISGWDAPRVKRMVGEGEREVKK
jgi:hypothetical protein